MKGTSNPRSRRFVPTSHSRPGESRLLHRRPISLWLRAAISGLTFTVGCGDGESMQPPNQQEVWSAPAQVASLGRNHFGFLDQLELRIDEAHRGLLLWNVLDSTFGFDPVGSLWWSRSDVGSEWAAPSFLAPRIMDFELSQGGNGEAIVVWQHRPFADFDFTGHVMILSSRYAPDQGWSPDNTVADVRYVGFLLYAVSVALGSQGQALTLWAEDPQLPRLYASRSASGSSWSRESQINQVPGASLAWFGRFLRSNAAFDAAGNGVAVWLSQPQSMHGVGERSTIWSSRSPVSEGWQVPEAIGSGSQGFQDELRLAVTRAGDAAAVWIECPDLFCKGPQGSVMASHARLGGSWTVPRRLGVTDLGNHAAIASDADGQFMVVWSEVESSPHIAFARLVRSGDWVTGTVAALDPDAQSSQPDLAVSAGGDAIAVWTEFDGALPRIAAARYSGVWQSPSFISSDSPGVPASRPRIAMAPDGAAIAVWQQLEATDGVPGGVLTIWASRSE